jgi:hypothetical protein
MKTSAVVLLLLVVLVLVPHALLLVLAYASPPDPAWIPGIYDDADYDDIIALITSATASAVPLMAFDSRPMPSSVERAAAALDATGVPAPSRSASPPRAPPAP